MESTNMSKHFRTLQAQRAHYLPAYSFPFTGRTMASNT